MTVKDTLYIATRADLEPGDILAQSVHAGLAFAAEHAPAARWAAAHLVVKAVPDEATLGLLLRDARGEGIRTSCFHEPDMGGALTAIVLEPGSIARRILARYPLALSPRATSPR